jgi:hypothetical protein
MEKKKPNTFTEIIEKCAVMSHGHFKYAHYADIRPNQSHEVQNFINMFVRKFSQPKFQIKNYRKWVGEKYFTITTPSIAKIIRRGADKLWLSPLPPILEKWHTHHMTVVTFN